MNLLTGISGRDFLTWLYSQGDQNESDLSDFELNKFFSLSTTSQYAILIEWLDTVGIYVEICRVCSLFDYLINDDIQEVKKGYKTRQEATKAAIEKANELYNQRTLST